MTLGDYISIVEAYWHISTIQIEADRATIRQALNESGQRLYPLMVAADDTVWIFSSDFLSTTDATYPANYGSTRLVEVPSSGNGAARRVSFREFQTVQNNAVLAATSSQPIYRQDATALHLAPAVAGTHYYVRTFGELTDDTVELTTFGGANPVLIAWDFEEAFVLGALHILANRELGKPGIPETEVKKLFDLSEATKAVFDQAAKQGTIWRQTTLLPKIPQVSPVPPR